NTEDLIMEDFTTQFIAKYGINRPIRVLDIFRQNFTIASPEQRGAWRLQTSEFESLSKFYSMVRGLAEQKMCLSTDGGWHMDDQDIELIRNFQGKAEDVESDSYYGGDLNVELVKDPVTGKTLFRISDVVGSTFPNTFNSRFFELPSGALNNPSNRVYALQFVNRKTDVQNVQQPERRYSRTVIVSGPPSSGLQNCGISQLHVIADETKRLRLIDPDGNAVSVVMDNMVNQEILPPVLRFIMALSGQGQSRFSFTRVLGNLGQIHQGRISYGDIIIMPEKWFLSRENQPRISDLKKFRTFIASVVGQTTEHIVYTAGDQRIPLRLDNKLDLQLLLEYFNSNKKITLCEYLPAATHAWQDGQTRATELTFHILSTRDKGSEPKIPDAFLPYNDEQSQREMRFSGYTSWFYAILYTDGVLDDQLVAKIANFAHAVQFRHWFYIRYYEETPEIRFRMFVNQDGVNQFYRFATSLIQDGTITDYSINTYSRELERYGGAANIDKAEAVFHQDSELCATLLSAQGFETGAFFNLNCKLVAEWLKAFNLPRQWELKILFNSRLTDKNLKKIFRYEDIWNVAFDVTINDPFCRLITGTKSLADGIDRFPVEYRSEIVSSILHMHFNRMFGNLQTEMDYRTQIFRYLRTQSFIEERKP
ncbi:thiopeptide-type bacteriocin biosynthesis protein, partial [Schleiferilactobacillus harbinensis]